MSLYEMLPQKLPPAESLPDSDDSRNDDAWLDPFSALADEALEAEISLGVPQNALAGDAEAPGGGLPPDIRDEESLLGHLRQTFAVKLPQIAEYREKGYNLSGPDEGAMKKLAALLQKPVNDPYLSVLAEPARRFLTFLQEMALNDRNMSPVLQEAVLQADRLLNLLVTALEALAAGARVGPLDWEAEARKQARQARDRLVADLPDTGEEARRQAGFSLTSESFLLTPEYRKFAKLRDSLLAESRIVRHRLTAHLEEKTARTEEGARDVREYALNTLLAQSAAKPSGTPEQLAVWGARFQQYARHLPGRDDSFDNTLLAGNPLAAALSSVMKPSADEPLHVRLARAMLPVTTALGGATALLVQAQQRVALPETETKKITVKPHVPLLQKVRTAGHGVLTGTVNLARKTGHRTARGAFRTGHLARHVLHRATDPDGLNRAVRNTGLLLLDEIQQTERQMSRLATQAWLLQEATEQQWRVEEEPASLAVTQPELAARLDAALAQEALRWQLIAQQALTQLETLLASSARLTETAFYSELSEELQQARALSEEQRFPDIARMAETMTGVADGLAGIVRGLNSAVIRLSEHGYAGGAELNALLGSYRRELNQLKAQVKTRVTGITGSSLANFSRGGMLARGVAEWAEALKQAWLAGLPPAQRAEARVQFERALMTVLAENREHFAGKSDPQAEGFMKRLTLALQHAATGSQVYPPTAEEILAGSRSVPEDVRRWAERKVLGGALWAALRGGFNLVTGPVSLPVRVAIRGARTGYTLAGGLRQMNRVRLGEGPATLVKRQYISQEMAKIGIRLALSLSPVTGWGVAVTVTLTEAGKNLHDRKALKKMAKRFALNIPEEGLWAGGYAGMRAGINASVQAWTEYRMRQKIEEIVADMLAPQADSEDDFVGEYEADEQEITEEETADEEAEYDPGPAIRTDAETGEESSESVSAEGSLFAQLLPDEDAQGGDQAQENPESRPGVAIRAREQEKPDDRPRRIAPSARSGVKSFAGGAPKAASLAPASQATPAIEPADEAEEETPRSRGKRAAETEKLPPSRYYYPAPNRETAIDIALEVRILQLFPIKNGHRLPADQAVLSAPRQKVYLYDTDEFLYIGGRYRYIKFISKSEDGGWEAAVYPYRRAEDEQNQPIKIIFNTLDNKWYLDESEENKDIAPDPDVVTTTYLIDVDPEVNERAKTLPENKAYTYDQMLPGTEGQIYDDGERNYIFLGGRYWHIEFPGPDFFIIPEMDEKLGNKIEYVLSTELKPHDKPVAPRKTIAAKREADISPAVAMALKSITPGAGYPFRNLEPGIEGAVYISGEYYYIFLLGKYWPVRVMSGNLGEVTIRTDKQGASVKFILLYDNGTWKFKEGRGVGDNLIQSSVSPAVSDELKNADADSQFSHPSVKTAPAGFIYKHGKDNYIFINGAFYSFQWISESYAAIKYTVSGKTHLLFINKKQQQWEFLEKNASQSYEDFDDALRLIKRLDVEPGIHKKLQHLLTTPGENSWQNISVKLLNIFEEEIYKRYVNPADKYLKDLLIAKSRIDAWINEEERKSLLSPERDWLEPLAALYRDALSRGTSNPAILGAAQEAKAQIKALEKKRDELTSTNIDNRLAEVERDIEDYELIIFTHTNMLNDEEEAKTVHDLAHLDRTITGYNAKLAKAQEFKKMLGDLKDKITEQRKEYDQQIKTLQDTYKVAIAGIALGEKTLSDNLSLQGESKDEIIATEAAFVELALKEVSIVSKDRYEYTAAETEELEKIRVAKSFLMFRLEQSSKYTEIVGSLKDSDIVKPTLKNNYSDIIWADKQGEILARKIFPDDDDIQAKAITSAICYWLLKKDAKIADLQLVKVNKVLENYYTDFHAFNPLNQHKEMPADFVPLSGLMASEYFESQADYNKQFSDYKTDFAEYEASEIVKDLLSASQLSLEEMQQPVRKQVRLRITTGENKSEAYSGEMVFIQLADGRWIFFSLFPGRMFSKIFTEQEVNDNAYLSRLTNIKDLEGYDRSGIMDLFPMDFFYDHDFPGSKVYASYDSTAVRWHRIKTKVMENILYTGSGDDDDSPPFSRDKPGLDIHRIVFKYSDNGDVESGTNVIDVLNKSMTAVLGYSADEKKTHLYKPSLLQRIAVFIVPFYGEIYKAITDPESTVDETSILLDALGVVTAVSMAGVKVAAIIKNTKGIVQLTRTGLKNGLSGQPLRLFVAKELGKLSDFKALQISKVAASTAVDILDPFMVKEVAKFSLKQGAKAATQLASLAPGGAKLAYNFRISSKHKLKDINLEEMEKEVVHGNEVYSTLDSKSKAKKYYIKTSDDEVFQVRWDAADVTWRTVDPRYPNKLSYGQPVEFSNGEWKVKYLNPYDKNMFARFTPKDAMRDVARQSQLSPDTSGVCWDYAVDLIENAKLLTPEKATELRKGIKLASRYQSGDPSAPGGISKLFESTETITDEEALLRVKPGQVIVFMATDPNSPTKGARPIHAMVSIGNGRFAGMKNSILHTSLSDEKKILTAEQLGEFKEGSFKLRGSDQSLTDLHIIAGEPKDMMRKQTPSLRTLAELSVPGEKVDTIDETKRILKATGELDWQQANALGEELRALFRPKEGTVIATNHSVANLFNSAVDITNRSGLEAVKKGQLVVITEPYSSFSIQHFMIGLGNGEFMMINPHLLDASLAGSSGIVKASQFSDELFTKFRMKSGDVSLGNLRMSSLLGRESEFKAIGSELIVRMHGAPMMAHGMDAYELSEAIRGLALRSNIDLSTIKEIKLESCFGAFGFVSTGKALAHLLKTKVTAYPFVFNNMMRRNTSFLQRARTFVPTDLGPAELSKMTRQNSRNHNFWNHLYTPALVIGGHRSPTDFMDVLDNVKLLAQGKMSTTKFFEYMPEFKSKLYITEKEFTELVSNKVSRGTVEYAQRCWDILMTSTYSASLVDKALGGSGN